MFKKSDHLSYVERRQDEIPSSPASRVSRVGEVGVSLVISHSVQVENLGGEVGGLKEGEKDSSLESQSEEFEGKVESLSVSEKKFEGLGDVGEAGGPQGVSGVNVGRFCSFSGDRERRGGRKRVPSKKYDNEQYSELR